MENGLDRRYEVEKIMSEESSINRRSFMSIAIWTIGGLLSIGIGIPAIAYIISPGMQRNKSQVWTRLGFTSKVELSTPTLFKAKVENQTGWIKDVEELSVYVLTDNGRDFIGMSNICTHLVPCTLGSRPPAILLSMP